MRKINFLSLLLLLAGLPDGGWAGEFFSLPGVSPAQVSEQIPPPIASAPAAARAAESRGMINIRMDFKNATYGGHGSLEAVDKANNLKTVIDWYTDEPISYEPLTYSSAFTSTFGDLYLSGSVRSTRVEDSEMVYSIRDENTDLALSDDTNYNESQPVGGLYGYLEYLSGAGYKKEFVSAKMRRQNGSQTMTGEGIDLRCGEGAITGTFDEGKYSRRVLMAVLPLMMRFCTH